jgi:hypothetical protein
MAEIPSLPDGARGAFRDFSAVAPEAWFAAYIDFVAAIRREVRLDLRSFDPIHRWRGCAGRVLLRNPYADIGITTDHGLAAVWIGERVDRDYRIRCEWTDVSGVARRWLTAVAPTFDAVAARLGCTPDQQDRAGEPRWLEAA